MKRWVLPVVVVLLTITSLAMAGEAPTVDVQTSTRPTLYDFYEQMYPPTMDPFERARLIQEAVLNNFQVVQNAVHNPYKNMRDEWFRMNRGSRLAEKVVLTWLYSTVEDTAAPDQFVRVMVAEPKDIEKYLVLEKLGRLNRPRDNRQGLLIDFHTHQGEIGMSYDSIATLERSLVRTSRKGLDGVVVTNHDVLIDDLEARVEALKDQGKLHRDFLVILGMEYTSLDAGHLILVGLKESPTLDMGYIEVCRLVHAQGGKVIVAHPAGIESMIAQNPVVDGVMKDRLMFPDVLSLIIKNGQRMPVLANSDSHFPSWNGFNATRVFASERSEQGVLEAIGEGKVEPVLNPYFAKADRTIPRIGFLNYLAKAKFKGETTLARATGADFVTIGKNALLPDVTSIYAGYGSYIVTYDRDNRCGGSQVAVRRSFSF